MATLLGALESMKAKLEDDEDVKSDDTEIEAAMIALMEAEQEVEASNTEIMELDGVVDEAEEAIGRLEGIRDAILEYGISKSMMKAADPKGELCAAGIVASYEELEDTPVKDENAEAAVEGIGDKLREMWQNLIEFFKTLGKQIMAWFSSMVAYCRNLLKIILRSKTAIKEADEGVIEEIMNELKGGMIENRVATQRLSLCEAISNHLIHPASSALTSIHGIRDLNKAVDNNTKMEELLTKYESEINTRFVEIATKVGDSTTLDANKLLSKDREALKVDRTLTQLGWHNTAKFTDLLDALGHQVEPFDKISTSVEKLLMEVTSESVLLGISVVRNTKSNNNDMTQQSAAMALVKNIRVIVRLMRSAMKAVVAFYAFLVKMAVKTWNRITKKSSSEEDDVKEPKKDDVKEGLPMIAAA